LWPSGIALAASIARAPDLVRNARCLELGCGLGVTAVAALRAGADLLATDYAPQALALCRHNCLVNAGRAPRTLQMNWRRPTRRLRTLAGQGFPVVLAADVLYERRDVEPLLDLVDWLVAPGGLLWLAEPGRPPAAAFLEAATERGWRGAFEEVAGPWPDPNDREVIVRVHRLRRGASRSRPGPLQSSVD
jgi:predicted nicotinamide N-methyase